MLLWRGIGAYVARHPRYKKLFGPVSISTEYTSISRQLLIAFLTYNRYLPDLGKLIRPLHPPKRRPFRDWDERETSLAVRDVDEVNDLISQIETDRKSMPVLLRQYLKLNARLLAFNVDPDFGDVLDGLMLVDLTKVDRNVLWRYMGKESARIFLDHHESLARV
jgi:putative hemolysin